MIKREVIRTHTAKNKCLIIFPVQSQICYEFLVSFSAMEEPLIIIFFTASKIIKSHILELPDFLVPFISFIRFNFKLVDLLNPGTVGSYSYFSLQWVSDAQGDQASYDV